MIQTATALKAFFSGFGIPAYTADTVPEDVDLPYITYSLQEPEWNEKASLYAQVWDYSRSNAYVLQKADEIAGEIGEGKILPIESGYVVIWPSTPLIQLMPDGDVRSAYISLNINAYHKPGH